MEIEHQAAESVPGFVAVSLARVMNLKIQKLNKGGMTWLKDYSALWRW